MTVLKVLPLDEKPKPVTTQWSLGLAMFAAFVVPFLLLLTSTRYQVFIAQARAKLSAAQQQAASTLQDTKIQWPTSDE